MKEAAAEYLKKAGFKSKGVNNLRSFYDSEEELEEAILCLLNTTLNQAQIYHKLTERRGAGKSHASANGDTGKLKAGKIPHVRPRFFLRNIR